MFVASLRLRREATFHFLVFVVVFSRAHSFIFRGYIMVSKTLSGLKKKKKGAIIVFDGDDGLGKGTQIELLARRAEKEARNYVILNTREPGGTDLAEYIREGFKSSHGLNASALTNMLLMWAARRDLWEKTVIPAQRQGFLVVVDRSDSSTFAYQVSGQEGGISLGLLFWEIRRLVFGSHAPDKYIIFDVGPAESQRRIQEDTTRSPDGFDLEGVEFHAKVRRGFLTFAQNINKDNPNTAVVINGMRPPEEVHEDVWAIVKNYL